MLGLFYILLEGVVTIVTVAICIQLLTLILDKNGEKK